jgi:hypothetical protein
MARAHEVVSLLRQGRPCTRLLLLGVVLSSLVFSAGCGSSSLLLNAPSIDRLVSNYETHRRDFAALARMASHDPRFSLQMTKHGAYLQSAYSQALNQGRIKQYEPKLRPIGGVSLDSFAGDLDVTLGSSGLVAGGDTWGYIRSKKPPAAVVTLKQAHAFFHDPWCYSLGDGWYAYNFNN